MMEYGWLRLSDKILTVAVAVKNIEMRFWKELHKPRWNSQTLLLMLYEILLKRRPKIRLCHEGLNKIRARSTEIIMRVGDCHPYAKFLLTFSLKSFTFFKEENISFGENFKLSMPQLLQRSSFQAGLVWCVSWKKFSLFTSCYERRSKLLLYIDCKSCPTEVLMLRENMLQTTIIKTKLTIIKGTSKTFSDHYGIRKNVSLRQNRTCNVLWTQGHRRDTRDMVFMLRPSVNVVLN